ncbi:MAG: hypothetical protein WC284_16335 [Candidimonas sp.]
MAARVNYLNNKEMLEEIHLSKLSYCSLIDPLYQDEHYKYYDIIVRDLDEINDETIQYAKEFRAQRLYQKKREEFKKLGFKPHEIKIKPDPNDILTDDLVFRVMTFDHIPLDPDKAEKKIKKAGDRHVKVNFPPFKHFIIRNGQFIEVLRSHWTGLKDDGEFCMNQGKMTYRLSKMFVHLTERYAQRGNWRGYTYNDEMRSQALMQLAMVGLQFDESRSNDPKPFAYYTAVVTTSFTRILNLEKKSQMIRDDLLIMAGSTPSFTRQVEHEMSNMDPIEPGEVRYIDPEKDENTKS